MSAEIEKKLQTIKSNFNDQWDNIQEQDDENDALLEELEEWETLYPDKQFAPSGSQLKAVFELLKNYAHLHNIVKITSQDVFEEDSTNE